MDQRVEKLEDDVNSLNVGQQQIMDKLNELFDVGQQQIMDKLNELFDVGQQQIMDKLNEQFEKLNSRSANIEPEVGENPRNTNGNRQNGSHKSFAPKLVKLNFPRFNSDKDTTSWTCRVEQFFQFHQTPEEERVALASFHLEGGAQL
ncbi:hypothetical protein AMTRI_Chr11g98820 [Amborella trichopoda]